MLEVAQDFPEYTFAVADEDDFATEVKDLGLSESGEDVNAAILDEGGRKFAMEPDEFDSDTLREFVTAFKKGGLRVAGLPLREPGWLRAHLASRRGRSSIPSLVLSPNLVCSLGASGRIEMEIHLSLSFLFPSFFVIGKRAGMSWKCQEALLN